MCETESFYTENGRIFFLFCSNSTAFECGLCLCVRVFFFFLSKLYTILSILNYIKFDEIELLALNLACVFVFFSLVGFKSFILVVICIRVLLSICFFFLSFFFSFLCSFFLPLLPDVCPSSSFQFLVVVFISTALRARNFTLPAVLIIIYTPLRLN